MQERVCSDVTKVLLTTPIASPDEIAEAEENAQPEYSNVTYTHSEFSDEAEQAAAEAEAAIQQSGDAGETAVAQAPIRRDQKVGRNEPCPCGSGKKFKQCHGRLT